VDRRRPGGVAAYRLLRRWEEVEQDLSSESAAAEPDVRAAELRAKLAESREEEQPAEPAAPESLDDRRRRVHEEGRAAIDEMQQE